MAYDFAVAFDFDLLVLDPVLDLELSFFFFFFFPFFFSLGGGFSPLSQNGAIICMIASDGSMSFGGPYPPAPGPSSSQSSSLSSSREFSTTDVPLRASSRRARTPVSAEDDAPMLCAVDAAVTTVAPPPLLIAPAELSSPSRVPPTAFVGKFTSRGRGAAPDEEGAALPPVCGTPNSALALASCWMRRSVLSMMSLPSPTIPSVSSLMFSITN